MPEQMDSHVESDCTSSPTNGKAWWSGQEDIVITGVSCRLPESDSMAELEHNLMNKIDMITEDRRRWEPGFYGLPARSGKVKETNKFDAQFFGVSAKQAHTMDPQLRLLLEVVYEALVDSGSNVKELRGSKTGVFVGASGSESGAAASKDPEKIVGYSLTGTVRSMFANRVSFSFDFRGPSFSVDTACSSALQAMQLAVESIRTGDCDAAIVAGTNLTLTPTTALQFLRLGMLSPEGKCQSFDASGDGYVRSEGVVAIFLQKKSAARRLYASVVHAKCNTDGAKEQGITFPSGDRQAQLLRDVYEEAGLDPVKVNFVETHGTGTKVGDPLEAASIAEVFCENRTTPLLIASIKSNLGHCEPASGLASLAKVIINIERGVLTPNLHFHTPNPNIPALVDGRLKVVTEKTEWNGGYMGINSFGFGGSNAHVVLKTEKRTAKPVEMPAGPKLLVYSGRTKEAIEAALASANHHPDDHHLYTLLSEQSDTNTVAHPWRGFLLSHRVSDTGAKLPVVKGVERIVTEKPPVWFIFSGMGSQWNGMGREMMRYGVFKDVVMRADAALKQHGMSVYEMIMEGDEETYSDTLVSFVCIATIQMAMTELLKFLGVEPDGILGHSVGELGCSYADDCLTVEETVLCAYWRGTCVKEAKLPPGGMAAVGLSWKETARKCPPGIVPACNNAEDSVTVSGPAEQIKKFVAQLNKEGIFAKEVNSSGRAFHSYFMEPIGPALQAALGKVIKHPKLRSERWISSSNPESEWETDRAKYCSADYHAHNVTSPVLFYEGIEKIPENAVVIEIAPHCLLQAILRRCLKPSCTTVGLNTNTNIPPAKGKPKIESNIDFFKTNLGKLYCKGITVHASRLYPSVTYPIPTGVPMVSSLVKWDHTDDWEVMTFADVIAFGSGGKVTSSSFTVDPYNPEMKEEFYLDHQIDGRHMFPFTGYLLLAWKGVCRTKAYLIDKTPIVMENVNVYLPVLMSKAVKFDISVHPSNGDFEIMEDDSLLASGRIYFPNEETPYFYEGNQKSQEEWVTERIELNSNDVYKELQLRGYEYGPNFRTIEKAVNSGQNCTIRWDNNWVTFLDAMLQAALISDKSDALKVPTRLRYLRIDPYKHRESAIEVGEDHHVINVTMDAATQGCFGGGIELRELTCQTIPRRLHSQHRINVEKIYFLPHQTAECFKEFPALQQELHEYRNFATKYVAETVKLILETSDKTEVDKQLPNTELMKTTFPGKVSGTQMVMPKYLSDHKHGLAKVFERINQLVMTTNVATEDLFPKIKATLNLAENAHLLQSDIFLKSSWLDRPAKLMIDIILESTSGHHPKFNAFEPESTQVAVHLRRLAETHPQVETYWTLVGTNMESWDQPTLVNNHFKVVKFNPLSAESTPDKPRNFDATVLDCILSRRGDIEKYLGRVKDFLRPDGFVLVNEVTDRFEVAFALASLRGETDVLAPFEGVGERHLGRFYSHQQWLEIFDQSGFKVVAWQSDSLMTTLYLLHKVPPTPKQPAFVDIDDLNKFTWIKPLQETLEQRLNLANDFTVWTVSNKTKDNGALGFSLCLREETTKNRIRSLMDASLRDKDKLNWTLESPEVKKIVDGDIFSNVYRDGVWGSFRHLPVREDHSLIDVNKFSDVIAEVRDTEHAFINTIVRGDLTSLAWFESSNKYFDKISNRSSTQFLCSVYFASLNFRDIMLASGRLSIDAVPGNLADKDCVLGMEYSGRDSSSGKRLMGLLPSQALATTLVGDSRYAWEVPDHWSLEQAATVPVVYATVYYALIVRGELKRGEKVLIHAGSGGVGQAAIAVCLSYGCEVFTTVSSEEKRQFLLKKFPQLDDHHINNSRSTKFESEILRATRSLGVNVVLNSLSEDKLQASTRILAQHGRFLEIGKFDLSSDSGLGMSFFLKNVTFHGILLDALFEEENEDWGKVSSLLSEGIRSGVVQPLPTCVFEKDQVEEAFRYMAQGKHIGKVVIKMRPEENITSPLVPKPILVRAIRRTLCHPQRVYIITGGLGGFGLELAQWLINRGAKKLILTSRSGIRTGYQARCIHYWRKIGISILISTINVGYEDQTKRLMELAQEIGPIGGIFHLALVLNDSFFENQTAKEFQDASVSKYLAAKHLDSITRKVCDSQLEWFVVFSSIVCGRGNGGQTTYGWANSAMERLIEQRTFDGLHGLAIQWGAVGDVGFVLENMGNNETIVGGTVPQRMPACLSTLDVFLTWKHSVVSSFIRADTGGKKADLSEVDVLQTIAHILGNADPSRLDPNAPLGDLGLDSLMGVEIKQTLERQYDVALSMKDIRYLTLNKVRQLVDDAVHHGPTPIKPAAHKKLESKANDKDEGEEQEEDHSHHEEIPATNFFRLKVNVNSLRPTQPVVKINNVTEGPPVFCVHSIEGVGEVLSNLAAQINLPLYCFQCVPEAPLDTIESLAAYYTEEMMKIQPTGPYRLIGYSYGASVAFDMAIHIQNLTGDPHAIQQLLLIDGSHAYMQNYRKVYRVAFNIVDDAVFETEVLCAFAIRFVDIDYRSFRKELLGCGNWHERVEIVVDKVMSNKQFKSRELVAYAAESLCKKLIAADRYFPTEKFQGDITLIKAESGGARPEIIGHDYGIGKVATGKVTVHTIAGDHDSFVDGKTSAETAAIIEATMKR